MLTQRLTSTFQNSPQKRERTQRACARPSPETVLGMTWQHGSLAKHRLGVQPPPKKSYKTSGNKRHSRARGVGWARAMHSHAALPVLSQRWGRGYQGLLGSCRARGKWGLRVCATPDSAHRSLRALCLLGLNASQPCPRPVPYNPALPLRPRNHATKRERQRA